MATVDQAAIETLRTEVLDWRHRWVPPEWYGRTIGEVLAGQPVLADLDGPVATIDRAALRYNMSEMAAWCARTGVTIAPHGKTTMAPQLIAEQVGHGAWAVTVASLAQARVLRTFGVNPIIVANEVVDPAGLAWVVAEQRRDPAFRLLCWVDSAAGVALLDDALRDAPRQVEVLVEMGFPGGRAGCRTVPEAVAVAAAAAAAPRLRLAGVAGYEGVVPSPPGQDGVAEVDAFLLGMGEAARRIAPLMDRVDEVILSAGGSSYFDRVAALLGPDTLDCPVRTVVRSGCYLTHDSEHYVELTPSARGVADAPRFTDALRVWARVLSRPEPELAMLAAGRRDLPYDQGLPRAVRRPGWRVTALNDQHAYLAVGAGDELRVGDRVELGISHPCTLFDRWSLLPVVEDGAIVDLVRTFF